MKYADALEEKEYEMAKANIDLPDGTKITIDGSVEEVAKIIGLVQGNEKKVTSSKRKSLPTKTSKKGIKDYILDLKEEGFFKERKSIADVKDALESRGQIYAVTSLSGPLLDLVRNKDLGRVKEDQKWMYVHRD